jgi:cytochrome c5
MKFKNLIYLMIVPLILFNCSSSSNDDLTEPDPAPVVPVPTVKVTYDANVKAIMSSKCTGCHGSTPSNGAPTSYATYNQVKNSIDKILGRINNAGNPMPQGGLMAQSLRDEIQQWKDDGLLEN